MSTKFPIGRKLERAALEALELFDSGILNPGSLESEWCMAAKRMAYRYRLPSDAVERRMRRLTDKELERAALADDEEG